MFVKVSPRNRTSSQEDSQDPGMAKSNLNGGRQSLTQRRTLFQKFLSHNNKSLNRSHNASSPNWHNNQTRHSSFNTDGGQVYVTPRLKAKPESSRDISQGNSEQVQVQVAAKLRDTYETNRAMHSRDNHDTMIGKGPPELTRERHKIMSNTSVPSPTRRLLAHERDGFCIAVDSYDGHTIYVDGTAAYEISTYLGGGVAGVVYEGRRLVPFPKNSPRNYRGTYLLRENSVLRDEFYFTENDHAGDELVIQASNICRAPMAYFCEPDIHESNSGDLEFNKNDPKTVRNDDGGEKQMNVIHRFAESISRRRHRNSYEQQQQQHHTNNNVDVDGEPNEDVAIKILNPIGFRLQSPSTCSTATIVQEGLALDEDIRCGLRPMTEKNVWWLVSPTSRNLKAYLDSVRQLGSSSSIRNTTDVRGDTMVGTPSPLDRGSPQKGIRMSMIAAYLDSKTGLLHEIPLPRCIEIWGHAPFGSSEKDFEEMMDAIDRVNDGQGTSETVQTDSNIVQHPSGLVRATVAKNCTVYCTTIDAYITVPAIPPKYLRWLRQRRAVTKEIRNMLRLGRHKNVVHLYEVLELIQDSKSIMFLVLELVRGGELFELISVNAKEGPKAWGQSENEDDAVMLKFFEELVSGIAYCHTHGVAHRDLKPENLLVHTCFNGERILKIADFGLSAPFSSAHLNRKDDDAWDQLPLCGEGLVSEQTNTSSPNKKGNDSIPTSPGPVTGLSPIVISHVNSLKALGSTALSFLTCGNLEYVTECLPGQSLGPLKSANPLARMKSVVGSPHYVAPEIICRVNDKDKGVTFDESGYDGTKADVWSAGVILYAMLFRSLPFGEDLLRCPRFQSFSKWYESARRIRGRRQSSFAALLPLSLKNDSEDLGPPWFFPSKGQLESKDLIMAMLNPDPRDRLSIEQVMCHPWLQLKHK